MSKTSAPSPPYPAIGLPDAIKRARRLAALSLRGSAPKDDVYRGLGFGSINGTSKSYVNALRQYGLLTAEGSSFAISPDVARLDTVTPGAERRALLLRVAGHPPIFRELNERRAQAPGRAGSDARDFLAGRGYRQPAIEIILNAYGATQRMLEREGVDPAADAPHDTDAFPSATAAAGDGTWNSGGERVTAAGIEGHASVAPERTLFEYELEDGCVVKIGVRGSARIDDILEAIEAWAKLKRSGMSRSSRK